MGVWVVLTTVILCVATTVVMIPLDIHPMFAVVPLLIGMVSALVVLVTVRRCCESVVASVLYGFLIGAVVGAAVAVLSLALLTLVGWTDGGHGGAVYLAIFSGAAVAGSLCGVVGGFIGIKLHESRG